MINNNFLLINVESLIRRKTDQLYINHLTYEIIEYELSKIKLNGENIIIFDFKFIFGYGGHSKEDLYKHKTFCYCSFSNFIRKIEDTKIIILLNAQKQIIDEFKDDFFNKENLFFTVYNKNLINNISFFSLDGTNKNKYIKSFLLEKLNSPDLFNKFTQKTYFDDLQFKLFGNKIKEHIKKNNVIKKFEFRKGELNEKHILNSTPVHVNKYVNVKPLLEDSDIFYEICYWLWKRISSVFKPNYLVAPSKNALAIASGLTYFFNYDIIVINQVSPITAFNNFSNIDNIKPDSYYAVVEDFFCMGTEKKVVEGILWSKGVNIRYNVKYFPIISSDICSNHRINKMNIFPLYILDKEFQYKIFTNNSCPICNQDEIEKYTDNCYHKSLF